MASGSPVPGVSVAGNGLPHHRASRRSSKRAAQCDDDMSDSDDDKPLAVVAPAPLAASDNRTSRGISACTEPSTVKRKALDHSVDAQAAAAQQASEKENCAPPAKKVATALPRMLQARSGPLVLGQQLDRAATPQSAPRTCGVVFGFSATAPAVALSPSLQEASSTAPQHVASNQTVRPTDWSSEAKPAQVPKAVASKPLVTAPEADKLPLPARIAECKARIAELQKQKAELAEKEDYFGAHHMKQQIQEQEESLRKLTREQDSMPTKSQSLSRASMAAAKVSVSGRTGQSPAKAKVRADPSANAFPRSKQLTDALKKMADAQPGAAVATTSGTQLLKVPSSNISGSIATDATDSSVNVREVDDKSPDSKSFASCGEDGSSEDAAEEDADEDEEMEGTGQWRIAKTAGHVELPKDSDAKPNELPFMIPKDIFSLLYPYQRAGVAWMARLWQSQQGGILADEMGLGKTVQVCGFLNGARKAGATHALLLLPVTLLDQWSKEARKWCPGWPVHIYYGTPGERARALRRLQRPQGGILLTSYQTLAAAEALFEVPVRDEPSPRRRKKRNPKTEGGKRRKLGDDDEGEEFEDSEEEVLEPETPGGGLPALGTTKPWSVVICDEAHRIKNISTLLGKTMRSVRADCRILLSGTPVQNALQDLWSLMDFAQPGLLGNHATFVKHFSDPIDRGSFGNASTFQVELKKHLAEQLRQLITPHLLRRTKVNAGLMAEEGNDADACMDVADDDGGDAQAAKLPPKRETIIWLAPSNEQLEAYKKVLELSDVIREACSKSKLGFEVFQAIGLLKRLCNHPALLLPMKEKTAWRDYLNEATEAHMQEAQDDNAISGDAVNMDTSPESSDTAIATSDAVEPSDGVAEGLGVAGAVDDADVDQSIEATIAALGKSADDILSYSSKLRCLNSLLPALAKRGHRTLVFSQSLKMLDLIQVTCLKPNNLRCLRIDGQTAASERHEKVLKFNKQRDRFQCMLLTTSVGGVGLNLTSADRVILVDPAWNPATDAQAVDRAFRIGQDKEVRVYRLIMSGLIEDKMFRLQVFKMGLTKTALESSDQSHRYFTQREIKALFDWTDPSVGETRKMLLDKHGESDETKDLAADDGAEEDGWLSAGPAVGLSDFAQLYGSFSKEEEQECTAETTAQVDEAKMKLGAADEKLQQKMDVRQRAEKAQDKKIKDLELANKALEGIKERRNRLIEVVRERNSEAVQERRSETTAQRRMEQAQGTHVKAEEKQLRCKQTSLQNDEELLIVQRSTAEAHGQVATTDEAFKVSYEDAKAQCGLVTQAGKSTQAGVVEVGSVGKLRALEKAFEKVKEHLDKVGNRQVEFDFAEQELNKADVGLAEAETAIARLGEAEGPRLKTAELNAKKFRQDRDKCEKAQASSKEKVEKARDGMANAVQASVEAAGGFVESLQKAQDKPVKMEQVKAAQAQVKSAFKQFGSSFSLLRKAREAHAKILAWQRRASQKASTASEAFAEAERCLDDAQLELQKATEEEKEVRESRVVKDLALQKAEAARSRTEAEEADLKRRREELRADGPIAKEAVKTAKNAEREARNEREGLHGACSKLNAQHLQMEDAKNSAMKLLQTETYNATQVEEAYENRTKG